jgi:hypothetical protein
LSGLYRRKYGNIYAINAKQVIQSTISNTTWIQGSRFLAWIIHASKERRKNVMTDSETSRMKIVSEQLRRIIMFDWRWDLLKLHAPTVEVTANRLVDRYMGTVGGEIIAASEDGQAQA